MTSTAGTDPHPEVAEISDFSEGLLPAGRSAAVARHLDGCTVCSDVLRSLEEIRGLLGTLPGPQRMPTDIAGRIDAALAAEALLDATRPDVPRGTSASASSSGDVPRETSAGPSGSSRWSGPGSTGGRDGDSRGPGGPGGRRPADGGPGRRRRRGILAAASALGVLLVGGAVYAATTGGGGESGGAQDQARQKTAGAAASIGNRVHDLLAQAGGPRPGTGGGPVTPGTSGGHGDTPMLQPNTSGQPSGPRTASPVRVPDCVLKATHRSQPPLAADLEVFHGTQSYLVVFPDQQDASKVDAFVVNASCSSTSPGTVLFQGTYPR